MLLSGEGKGKPLQHSCLENPMNNIKKQRDMTLKDELKLIGAQYTWLLEKSQEIAPDGMKRLSQNGNNAQVWVCLVAKVKSDAVKNNTAQEPGMLGP